MESHSVEKTEAVWGFERVLHGGMAVPVVTDMEAKMGIF